MKAGMHYLVKLSKIIDGYWPTIMVIKQIMPKYNIVIIVYDITDKNYCHANYYNFITNDVLGIKL